MSDYVVSSIIHTLLATLLPHVTPPEKSREEWHHQHGFFSSVYTPGFLYVNICFPSDPLQDLTKSSSVFLSVPSTGFSVTIGTHQPGETLGEGFFSNASKYEC